MQFSLSGNTQPAEKGHQIGAAAFPAPILTTLRQPPMKDEKIAA